MQLRWSVNQSVSCLHAAAMMHAGHPFADTAWHEGLQESVKLLIATVEQSGLPIDRVWEHLVPQSAAIGNNRQLAQIVCQKVCGSVHEGLIQELAGCIGAVESAGARTLPHLTDELRLRVGPLREQWEARGPGLMKRFGELCDPALLAENAEIHVVHPALGGAGTAYLLYNSICMEGVLVNPLPNLPEVVRIGWLLGQLQCDLPMFGELVARNRLALVSSLATLPAILVAGEFVELCQANIETLEMAMTSWRVPNRCEAALLWDWWETYQTSRPAWATALGALDQLIGE